MLENFISWSGGHSYSSHGSSSSSSTALDPAVKKRLMPLVSTVGDKAGELASGLGSPNMNVYGFYTHLLMPNILHRYQRNVVPTIQSSLLSTLNSLSNRGILDSSVASRAIGNVMSEGARSLLNLFSDLQSKAVDMAWTYPLQSLQVLSPFIASLTDAFKESRAESSSSGSSSNQHFSYNPAPLLSLIGMIV